MVPLTKRSSDLEPGTRGDDALDGVAASHRLDYGCPSSKTMSRALTWSVFVIP
jgi:hypothetical protein